MPRFHCTTYRLPSGTVIRACWWQFGERIWRHRERTAT